MYQTVPFGTKGRRNASFICYYAKDTTPYQGASVEEGFPEGLDQIKAHKILMQMRWDAKLGFTGGMVEEDELRELMDANELLMDAAVRESIEEIGYEPSPYHLVPLNSVVLHDKDLNVHLYMCERTEKELYDMQRNYQEGKHALIEGMGVLVMTLTDVCKKNLLTAQLAKGVREELEAIYEFLG